MKYAGSLYAANNKEETIKFYKELFGLRVIQDFGTNFTFTGGLSFQTKESWAGFLDMDQSEIRYGGNDGEIYIETENLDEFLNTLHNYRGIQYIHPLKEHAWGQRGIRFYDPDFHIIEVSETLPQVCKRFYQSGMTEKEISERTGLSEAIIKKMLK